MGLGGFVAFNSEISHLSIGLTFSLSHFGHVSFVMLLPVSFTYSELHSAVPASSAWLVEPIKNPVPFGARSCRFRHGFTAKEAEIHPQLCMAISLIGAHSTQFFNRGSLGRTLVYPAIHSPMGSPLLGVAMSLQLLTNGGCSYVAAPICLFPIFHQWS